MATPRKGRSGKESGHPASSTRLFYLGQPPKPLAVCLLRPRSRRWYQPSHTTVKPIAVTGYGRESDLQLSHEAGFDYHLVKPVNPLRLLELLATLTPQPCPAT